MSFWSVFTAGLQQRCPFCLQKIPNEDIKTMKELSKNIGITICVDCWQASNLTRIRLEEFRYFCLGEEEEFLVHPHKPDSLVFKKGENLHGEKEKVFRNIVNFAKRYFEQK